MKYLIMVLLLVSGCHRFYTNEQCVTVVGNKLGFDEVDRQNRSIYELAASIECAKNGNDPEKTAKALSK